MKCILLAAGYATRLYPLTENFPKPLLKVGEKTILDWLLDDVKELVDEYNDRAVDRQIVNVRLHPEPFPMTETGKLQRWKLGEECLEKIGTNGNASYER